MRAKDAALWMRASLFNNGIRSFETGIILGVLVQWKPQHHFARTGEQARCFNSADACTWWEFASTSFSISTSRSQVNEELGKSASLLLI